MNQNKIVERERILTDSIGTLPSNYYQCIVADPPWPYENEKTGGSHTSGACQQYPVMTLEDIAVLPVPAIAFKDASVLYLWTTTPLKSDVMKRDIVSAWGFAYKTTIYWHKTGRRGLGYYHRGEVEECLVGIRGSVPAFREQTSNWFDAPVGKHSEKPQKFWTDYVFPVVNKFKFDRCVELFSRSPQPGWDAFGNEVKS